MILSSSLQVFKFTNELFLVVVDKWFSIIWSSAWIFAVSLSMGGGTLIILTVQIIPRSDIIFSTSKAVVFQAKFGLSCKYYNVFRKWKINYFKGKILFWVKSVMLEFGKLTSAEYILLWHYISFPCFFILWSSFWMIWWFRGVVIDMNFILTCGRRHLDAVCVHCEMIRNYYGVENLWLSLNDWIYFKNVQSC